MVIVYGNISKCIHEGFMKIQSHNYVILKQSIVLFSIIDHINLIDTKFENLKSSVFVQSNVNYYV